MNTKNIDRVKAATLDTGVLIEYFSLDKDKAKERKFLEQLEKIILETDKYRILYISSIVKTELLYIICRLKGWKEAKCTIDDLLTNFVVLRTPDLDEIAAQIKCKVPIALADCYTLAIGKFLSIPTYFIKERELTKKNLDIISNEFSINLKLIERPKID